MLSMGGFTFQKRRSMGGFKDDQVETTILKWVCANKNIQLVQKSMNKISNQINIFK